MNVNSPTDEMLLGREQVEIHFGLTRRWLEVRAVKGGGPQMVKLGRAVRYRAGDVRNRIDAQRVSSTSERGAA